MLEYPSHLRTAYRNPERIPPGVIIERSCDEAQNRQKDINHGDEKQALFEMCEAIGMILFFKAATEMSVIHSALRTIFDCIYNDQNVLKGNYIFII